MLAKPLKEVMMALHIPTDQDGSVLKDGSWVPVPKKKASKPHHETANENEKENDNENQSAAQEATHHHHNPNNRMEGPPNLHTSTSQDSGSTASSGISYLAAAQQPPKDLGGNSRRNFLAPNKRQERPQQHVIDTIIVILAFGTTRAPTRTPAGTNKSVMASQTTSPRQDIAV
jgi:hypothetical protein